MEPKLNFKDLEYIVMEGAGARGVAYLGAVRALEKLMKERMEESKGVIKVKTLNGRDPGLMDYYTGDSPDKEVPVIKGIAGSSAGAITAYALSLGLNSDEIAIILDYPFDNFLKEKDVGKYRMIDENNDLAIGEDGKKGDVGSKQLGNKVKKFEFRFNENETKVGGNPAKLVGRNVLFTLLIKIFIDGFRTQGSQFNENRFGTLVEQNDEVGFIRRILRSSRNFLADGFAAQKFWNFVVLKIFIPKVLKAKIEFDIDSVGNVFFDRGMFSGFAIREFFMDMTLYAATRDTHFHRRSVSVDEKGDEITVDSTTKDTLLEFYHFEIGERKKSKIGDNIKPDKIKKEYIDKISNMNFSLFQKITKTNFGVCVASLSTGNPLYFGAEWTPDFRVMEAVASSMTIPPAVKALYNASDVVKGDGLKTINITINGDLTNFVDSRGNFSESDYYLYEYVVKKALQEQLITDKKTFVDLNNAIELNSFFPTLQKYVVGEVDKFGEFQKSIRDFNSEVIVNGISYKVDYKLLQFFYNAVYKGLFIDGGYRINIPYNFYRLRNGSINSVLAIKIDENFPPTFLRSVYEALLRKVSINELELYYKIDDYFDNPSIEKLDKIKELLAINLEEIDKRKQIKVIIREETRKVFIRYLENKGLDPKELRKSEKVIDKIAKTAFKRFKNNKNTKPWATPVGVLSTAFDGFYYGAERGQIKEISDHNQIIPLYDYGVGTYDFDLKKVKPQAEAAKEEAEKQVLTFFNYDNNQ